MGTGVAISRVLRLDYSKDQTMLDFSALKRSLNELDCWCEVEPSFRELEALTSQSTRLICGAKGTFLDRCVHPRGFSFWVQGTNDLAILGLWSGRLFLVSNGQALPDLCVELCRYGRQANAPPSSVPKPINSRFKLAEVELLHLSDVDAARWEAALKSSKVPASELSQLIANLERSADFMETTGSGNVSIRFGNAHAITNMVIPISSGFITFAFHGGLRETDDDVRLLHLIKNATRLVQYDGSWGNQIDLADPYYHSPSIGVRPNEPANWQVGA